MPRRGNQMGQTVLSTVYPCAGGGPNDYVFTNASQQPMWLAMLEAMGRSELAEDARFAGSTGPRTQPDHRGVDPHPQQARSHARARRAGVPCGACQDTGEVLADPHLKAREMILDIDYPTRGTYKTVGCPIKLSDSPAEVTRPPLLGEHTEALLGELCGIGPEEVKRLHDDGVV